MANSAVAELSLGIDIGGTKAHGVVLDSQLQVVAEHVVPTEPGEPGVVRTVRSLAARLAEDLELRSWGAASVGIGVPGLVDPKTRVVRDAVNLSLRRSELGTMLAADFGGQVTVENDVKATAFGAGRLLGRRGSNLTYVNVGTGVAAATVSNGRLVRGSRNAAGELGHLPLDREGARCRCGQRGCVETVIGGGQLQVRLSERGLDLSTLGTIEGHRSAQERNRITDCLARLLTFVVVAYDSDAVVIGGGVWTAAGWLQPALREALAVQAEESALLAGLAIADRLVDLPPGIPVAAFGAALVGRRGSARALRHARRLVPASA